MTQEEINKHYNKIFNEVFDFAIDTAIEVINQCEDDDDWARFCFPSTVIEKLKALKTKKQNNESENS